MSENVILEGQITIQAVLESQSRPLYSITIQDNKKRQFGHLIRQAKIQNIPIHYQKRDAISKHANGNSHGGIIAIAGERHYVTLEDLATQSENPFVVMLDGIEDPYNFGQAIRALYAAGAHGLVLRDRNWLSAAGIVARSAAGTSERIAIARIDSPGDAVQHFKERGFSVVCTANQSNAQPLHKANLRGALFMVIGGEKRGIAKSILKQADTLIRIPYARRFAYSLGATAAASVIAFEVARQRGLS